MLVSIFHVSKLSSSKPTKMSPCWHGLSAIDVLDTFSLLNRNKDTDVENEGSQLSGLCVERKKK